jgi:hypothetical protein
MRLPAQISEEYGLLMKQVRQALASIAESRILSALGVSKSAEIAVNSA